MKLFVIQFVYGYLLIVLPSHNQSTFIKKTLFGWGGPHYPSNPYPGYPPPAPPGFGGLLGTIIGKLLSVKFGAPQPYPYPGYPPSFPPPFPGPFPPSFGFPAAFPAALPVPVPVPFPVDRPYPVPFGKPSLLPPITFVKHISESSKQNHKENSNSHPFLQLFQMSPPVKPSSSWSPMHDNHNSYSNHKEGWY